MPSDLTIETRLLQRYQNVKAELEAQQNLERIRMEKMLQSGVFTMSATTRRKGATARNTARTNNSSTRLTGTQNVNVNTGSSSSM